MRWIICYLFLTSKLLDKTTKSLPQFIARLHSNTPSYKYTLILKFLHRAFKLCSNFELFHQEIENVKNIFRKNDSSRSIGKKRLNDIVSVMQGFYFFVNIGLVLIYILKVYRKRYSSILLRKNMFSWKSRNYSQIGKRITKSNFRVLK